MKTENNILIAEFLGQKKTILEFPQFGYMTSSGNWKDEFTPNELKFHINWNWLMEVVEKIESLNYIVSTNFNSTDIKNLDTLKTITYNRGSLKQYTPSLTKIQSVHLACVEFIKWYNEQKN